MSAAALDAHCKADESLANFKRPRAYRFVDELPMTATGKKMHFKIAAGGHRGRAGWSVGAPVTRSEGDRVVITGLGAVTPLGNTWRDTWDGLTAGRSGVGLITQFDAQRFSTRIAAEVKGFDPTTVLSVKRANRSSRTSQLAVAAAQEAVDDAGLGRDLSELNAAVVVNSAVSGFTEIADAAGLLERGDARRISPSFVPSALTNMAGVRDRHRPRRARAGQRQRVGLRERRLRPARGPQHAARRRRRRGHRRWRGCGNHAGDVRGTVRDAGVVPEQRLPEQASRPFDAQRDGFVFGEGAVVFTMELLSHARARGAQVYAEVLGGALTSDGFNIVAPEPTGKYAALAITRALANAHLDADAIDMICAHGTSTRANDRTETAAIAAAFGEHARQRGGVGAQVDDRPSHRRGRSAGRAAVRAVGVDGVIPPTINYETPDPECFLDYVPGTAREQPVRYATTNAFGFGGQNCVVVFGRV